MYKTEEVLVWFNRREDPIRYTKAILRELRTDPDVREIMDCTTGEII